MSQRRQQFGVNLNNREPLQPGATARATVRYYMLVFAALASAVEDAMNDSDVAVRALPLPHRIDLGQAGRPRRQGEVR